MTTGQSPWVLGPWPEPHDRKPCRQLPCCIPRCADQRHARPLLRELGGEHRRWHWAPRPGWDPWRFGACCPPLQGDKTNAHRFARSQLAHPTWPYLAAWGRADHGLVRRWELGWVEQARAVDGHVIQRAEWAGTEVQVQAPETAEQGAVTRGPEPEQVAFSQSKQWGLSGYPPTCVVFEKEMPNSFFLERSRYCPSTPWLCLELK